MKSLFKKSSHTNLGSLLNLFSENEITLALVGVYNIESGHLSVRTERFNEVTQDYTGAFRDCSECVAQEEGRLFFSNCEACGKDESNFFWIPSGDGDGVYTAFELISRNSKSGEIETLGFATVLFPTNTFAEPIVEHALEESANSESPLYAFSFLPALLDPNNELEAFEVTKIKGSKDGWGLHLSDVTTTIDSDNAVVSLHLNNCKEITILAFSEEPESTQLAPKPRIVIGYSSNWLKEKGFSASMEKPYSRRVFDEWVITGITNCHLETMGSVATWFNFKMNEAMEKYNYAASWLLQGALHGDSDCQNELDRYAEYTSDPEWIATWLGQRNQRQAALDFEDGRLTYPFDKSAQKEAADSHAGRNKNESDKPTHISAQSNFTVPFKDRCSILGQFWFEFREDEDLKAFIEHNDVGLPLAWFIAMGVVEPLAKAEEFVSETFRMFLEAMEVTESDLEGIDNLNDFMKIASEKE